MNACFGVANSNSVGFVAASTTAVSIGSDISVSFSVSGWGSSSSGVEAATCKILASVNAPAVTSDNSLHNAFVTVIVPVFLSMV